MKILHMQVYLQIHHRTGRLREAIRTNAPMVCIRCILTPLCIFCFPYSTNEYYDRRWCVVWTLTQWFQCYLLFFPQDCQWSTQNSLFVHNICCLVCSKVFLQVSCVESMLHQLTLVFVKCANLEHRFKVGQWIWVHVHFIAQDNDTKSKENM